MTHAAGALGRRVTAALAVAFGPDFADADPAICSSHLADLQFDAALRRYLFELAHAFIAFFDHSADSLSASSPGTATSTTPVSGCTPPTSATAPPIELVERVDAIRHALSRRDQHGHATTVSARTTGWTPKIFESSWPGETATGSETVPNAQGRSVQWPGGGGP